jgi:hypothetical protein
MPPGGYSTGLAEPEARSVQEISDRGRRVSFTWFDPPFRPEPPHSNQAYGICFTEAGMIVLGGQRVDDPDSLTGPWRYYQTRFWARVELLRWDPQHEVDERRLVRPEDFLRTLSWGSAPSAAIILAEGLKAEAERGQG